MASNYCEDSKLLRVWPWLKDNKNRRLLTLFCLAADLVEWASPKLNDSTAFSSIPLVSVLNTCNNSEVELQCSFAYFSTNSSPSSTCCLVLASISSSSCDRKMWHNYVFETIQSCACNYQWKFIQINMHKKVQFVNDYYVPQTAKRWPWKEKLICRYRTQVRQRKKKRKALC